MTHTILIVDDEVRLAELLAASIADRGYQAIVCSSAEAALDAFDPVTVDLVISDLRMPGLDGRALLNEIRARSPDTPVVLITAYTSMRDAVEMVKEGAFDYISKPFEMDEIIATLERALRLSDAMRENARLRSEIEGRNGFEQLVGTSPAFRRVIEQIGEVCGSRATVLLTGESGTGKEVVARAIHFNSPRKTKPFVAVNCAAIPEGLIESELFGHVKGAFTGAVATRRGRFADADHGTVFLDEIGDMPAATQAKMLRVLQEQTFERVGGNETIRTDVRLIAATNRDLAAWSAEGKFRPDLYYRLGVFTIHLPPLRERGGDLPLLVRHFLRRFSKELGREVQEVAPNALERLCGHSWPGNIRELQSVLKQALLQASGPVLLPAFLPGLAGEPGETAAASRPGEDLGFAAYIGQRLGSDARDLYAEVHRQLDRVLLPRVMEYTNGNQHQAARLLGIARQTLRLKLRDLGLHVTHSLETDEADLS